MRERGDLRVLHEPFLAYYYQEISTRQLAFYDKDKDHSTNFKELKNRIIDAGSDSPVFFKDMSYYVTPQVFSDTDFLARCHHIFLIRDPRFSISSFYKLDPEFELVEVGLESQWNLYEHLRETQQRTLIVEAETIAKDPEPVMQQLWDFCGLPNVESAFNWTRETSPAAWHYVKGWHEQAMQSTNIRIDNRDPDNVFGQVATKAPHLREFIAHHKPFYLKLQSEALSLK